ncbi:sugar transferase [Dinghuibacter silviterrae]|uniref:Lipopolysaccharide/colanic/teichoic acid biosynthesis glycosyltransferase n=1 Tax=Dinghuibacter silviterrae TaxID=1539049 RepID=A0A4R8DUQ5_9BACT|nr:sugar transferase [Dinghuibacter silviterrae]TDX01909.1 lipopolysaccharide/colanic/teichoic acid biosynthesis glycosyltransferase [Dinghuibacter silviterrae]
MIETLRPYQTKRNTTEWKWHSHSTNNYMEPGGRNLLLIGEAAALYSYRLQHRGYTCVLAASIHEARNILLLEYYQQGRTLPEAILCDSAQDSSLIGHFAGFLSVTKEYARIPFILLSRDEDEEGGTGNAPIGVDDVFDGRATDDDLCAKIEVLKKYKHLRQTLPYHTREEQVAVSPRSHRFGQRTLDILVSGIALAVLSPVLLAVGLAIVLDSRGPVLYASPRAGRGYRIFKFYKFRTMVVGADRKIDQLKHLNQYDVKDGASGPMFLKIDKDPRVTRLGRFLRNTSLDELPQLLNVLLGDMSLVGNRPLPLYEACTLTADESVQRFLAPAGITGLWQIKKRGRPDMSVQERISLDIDYANQHSFFYDLRILLSTPKVLIQKADV